MKSKKNCRLATRRAGQPASSRAAQRTTTGISYGYTTADHVNIYVAQDLSLFKKIGLKPKFFAFPSGAPLLTGLKSERLDVVTAGLGLAFALGQTIPLSRLYVNSNDATGEELVVNESSPIKSYRDIGKAKKIGATSGTCALVALYLMAQKTGIGYAKMNIVNLPAPLLRNALKTTPSTRELLGRPTPWRLTRKAFAS